MTISPLSMTTSTRTAARTPAAGPAADTPTPADTLVRAEVAESRLPAPAPSTPSSPQQSSSQPPQAPSLPQVAADSRATASACPVVIASLDEGAAGDGLLGCGDVKSRLATFEGGYTELHMEMSRRYANDLAAALDGTPHALPPAARADLEAAGRVFDAGKLAVDEAIWNFPGRPQDPAEWKRMWGEMTRHASISTEQSRADGRPMDAGVEKAVEAASDRPLTDGARAIIRHHHEKMDGTGYPDGLKGEQTSVGARILGIADMFDALTNTRSFRPSKDYESARRILEEDASKGKIDAHLVSTFFSRVVPDAGALARRLDERTAIADGLAADRARAAQSRMPANVAYLADGSSLVDPWSGR